MIARTTILALIFFITLFIGCTNNTLAQSNTKDLLVQKFISTFNYDEFKKNGKIIVVQSNKPDRFDSKTYFEDYTEQIQVYSYEEAFMRGLKNNLEIEYLTVDDNEMQMGVKNSLSGKKVVIKI